MLFPSDDIQAGPVLVNRCHFHVDQAARERNLTDRVLRDVADVPRNLARPSNPQRSGRENPWCGGLNRGVNLGRKTDEVQQHVGATLAFRATSQAHPHRSASRACFCDSDYDSLMANSRSVQQCLVIAILGFLFSAAVIVALWVVLDVSWSLAFIPLMVVAGIAGYTYVLARRGL